MSEELSALDATFLELEQADPSAHMHIGAVLVFGPDGVMPTRDQLAERMSDRLERLPRFTQRLSARNVGGLHRPHWLPDAGFDIGAHIARAALPSPGGEAELLDWAGDYFSHRLDRGRPLWEVVLVEGLAENRWALAMKLHHCLADGVGSLEMTTLWEDHPHQPVPREPRPEPHAGVAELLRTGLSAIRHPRKTAGQAEALAALVVANEASGAPSTSLNEPIGVHRRLAVVHTTLGEISDIRRHARGTLNDVVLTAVTTGLRDLLVARGEAPPKAGLRAMIPVNVRSDSSGDLGNRVSSRFCSLPVAEPDLKRRHNEVLAASRRVKRGRQPTGAATLLELAEHLPPVVHATFTRNVVGTRLFNVTITNVPGPKRATQAFGATLEDIIPIVPLAAEHAVGIALISHAGELTLCINADRDTVPDVGVLADGIQRSLAELADQFAVSGAQPR